MPHMMSLARDLALPAAARFRRRSFGTVSDTIHVIQPDHLGDILLSQPAVRFLRDTNPDSRLVAVVGPWSREIAQIAWRVDEVIAIPFPGFARGQSSSIIAPYVALRSEARRLSRFNASTAFVLRPDAWWAAWLASLCAPAVVTSNDRRVAHFATTAVSVSDRDHATIRALGIAARGIEGPTQNPIDNPLSLPPSHESSEQAKTLLSATGITGEYLVI